MTAEQMRKVSGGVIGHLTPKECVINLAESAFAAAVGSNLIGLKVPAGKFIVGAYIKNLADDLASGGAATLGVTVGSDAIVSGTALATIKGAGKMTIATDPVFTEAESDVKLVVGTAALTAGKIAVGVIYG